MWTQYSGCHCTPTAKAARSLDRHGLDRAVLRHGLDLQPAAEPVDALAMHGIDHDLAGAEHAGKAASGLDRHALADGEALVLIVADRGAVVERALPLLYLGRERAAERDVEFLDAAADGEQRHAALDRLADQRQRRGVAVGIVGTVGLVRRRRRATGCTFDFEPVTITPSTESSSRSRSSRSPKDGTSTGNTPAPAIAASRYCRGAACQM